MHNKEIKMSAKYYQFYRIDLKKSDDLDNCFSRTFACHDCNKRGMCDYTFEKCAFADKLRRAIDGLNVTHAGFGISDISSVISEQKFKNTIENVKRIIDAYKQNEK